jgi:SAM-dependent methyltransferase
MDMWKFFGITHREHVVVNPMSEEKLARLVELLRLPPDAQVADIACGKGEFLVRLAEAYDICGVGVDISPFFIAAAEKRLAARSPGANIRFTEMNGTDFRPDEPESLDLVSCIGASWVFGGHAATLEVLSGMVKPGGWVIVGEPFWRQEPSEDHLAASGMPKEAFGTHLSNAEAGKPLGLNLVHTFVSSQDDWDKYEGLQWYSTADYARNNPDDPDVPTLVERVDKAKTTYLRWGRETLGWAIYMFRRLGSACK